MIKLKDLLVERIDYLDTAESLVKHYKLKSKIKFNRGKSKADYDWDKDIIYLRENKIFIMMLSRFMWEDLEKGVFRNYKRIKSVLKFNFIESVLAKNINQQQKNRNLELLAIKSNYNQNNLYDTNLIFSGNSIILIKTEEIDVILDDQEHFWEVNHSPKHKI